MRYLLDVNVLVAWGWADHTDHRRAAAWIGEMKAARGVKLITSSIPELGFVRVSVQRTGGRLPVVEAARVLSGMLDSLGKHHHFLPDDCSASAGWPGWCVTTASTTDAHLVTLAEHHECRLATLDAGIPSAFLIPIRQG